jgi:HAD superfamily hydrolase (TIGR01549 family)
MTAFIWDLDGTLIDSYDVFLAALSETFLTFDLAFDRDKIYHFIKAHSVNELLQNQPIAFEQLKTLFTEKSVARNSEIKLMTGAKEVLDWIKSQGIQNFIYTHKGKNTYHLVEQLGISHYFTEIVSSENGFPRKPDPAGVDYLLEKYKLDKATTYYIGDRQLDIEVAHHSGIQSINFLRAENSIKIDKLPDIMYDNVLGR